VFRSSPEEQLHRDYDQNVAGLFSAYDWFGNPCQRVIQPATSRDRSAGPSGSLAKEEDLAPHWREEVIYSRSASSPMQKLPHVTPLKLTRLRQPFDHPDWV
jgi:hypothetical protein